MNTYFRFCPDSGAEIVLTSANRSFLLANCTIAAEPTSWRIVSIYKNRVTPSISNSPSASHAKSETTHHINLSKS